MTYTCRISLAVAAAQNPTEIRQPSTATGTPLLLPQLAEFFCDGLEYTIEPIADTPTSPLLSFNSGIVRSPPRPERTTPEWTHSINAAKVIDRSEKHDSGITEQTVSKPAPHAETLEQLVTARSAPAHHFGGAFAASAPSGAAQQPQYVLLQGCSWANDDSDCCGSPMWHPFSSPSVLPLSVPQF